MKNHTIKPIISEQEIVSRIQQVADKINTDYKDKNILLICILKGAVFFAIELAKRITVPVEIEFMKISSYGNNTERGNELQIQQDVTCSIENRDVLVVEDIIDTGNTIFNLKKMLYERNPNSLAICTLLNKPERREVEILPEYDCFNLPEGFVVGFGLDYAQQYRNLPYIGILEFE